ncbi:MAG: HPr family phosphocarrier protein [Vicinamibacteria bacterium]|nr:HPr family phosphocarrier protein [Vicinamibacteria bacterium]
MKRKTVRVVNSLGFHARAAAKFVAEASRFDAQITVCLKDKQMDGKSILGLLLLAAPCGSSLQIQASGPDEKEAVRSLAALVAAGFGEAPRS